MKKTISITAGLFMVAAMAATSAQAIPIRSLPNLFSVIVGEISGSADTAFQMFPEGSVITTRRVDRLNFGNSDFASNASEFIDFFYSDADGTFNIDGAFLSVTAVFDGSPDSGLNISRVLLVFSNGSVSSIEFANVVSSFVALGTSPFPNTVNNALGDTPGTFASLGDTEGQPVSARLRLTLGFASTAEAPVTSVPEPGALALFGVGLVGLGLARRRRKVVATV